MAQKTLVNKLARRRGQGMTEYVIIVALISIAAIGVITLFGENIRALFGMSASALAGETVTDTRQKGKNTAVGTHKKTLSDFSDSSVGTTP